MGDEGAFSAFRESESRSYSPAWVGVPMCFTPTSITFAPVALNDIITALRKCFTDAFESLVGLEPVVCNLVQDRPLASLDELRARVEATKERFIVMVNTELHPPLPLFNLRCALASFDIGLSDFFQSEALFARVKERATIAIDSARVCKDAMDQFGVILANWSSSQVIDQPFVALVQSCAASLNQFSQACSALAASKEVLSFKLAALEHIAHLIMTLETSVPTSPASHAA